MRSFETFLTLVALSYLIIPAFLFVHAMAWDLVTGSNNISSTTEDRVMATVFVLVFWGLLISFIMRSARKSKRKTEQGRPAFTYTYVPQKREEGA